METARTVADWTADNGAITASSERADGGRERRARVTCDTESDASEHGDDNQQSTALQSSQYGTARRTSLEPAEHGGGAKAAISLEGTPARPANDDDMRCVEFKPRSAANMNSRLRSVARPAAIIITTGAIIVICALKTETNVVVSECTVCYPMQSPIEL